MIRITNLAHISLEQLIETYNLAFSDNPNNASLTYDEFVQKIINNNIDLDFSVGAFHQEELVGFILHGLGQSNWAHWVYNAGTGVIPSYRNLGLTIKMYQHILPILKEDQFKKIILDVTNDNFPAIKTFETNGFIKKRELLSYSGQISKLKSVNYIEIMPLFQLNWEQINQCWSIKPSWQNQISTIEIQKPNLRCFGAYYNETWVGYCIYHPKNHRLFQIGVLPKFRRLGVGTAMINHLSALFGKTHFIYNMDSSLEDFIGFFEKIGLKKQQTQLEYELNL